VKAAGREAAAAAKDAAQNPAQAYEAAKDGVLAAKNKAVEAGAKIAEGVAQDYRDAAAKGEAANFVGQAVGRVAFEVGSLLIGAGEAAKAGQVGKVAKAEAAVGKLGAEVLPCGKVVSKAAAAEEAFVTLGWKGAAVETDVGEKMIAKMMAANPNLNRRQAIQYVDEMLASGKALPEPIPIKKGEKLYKLTPGGASDASPYWMSESELEGLKGMSNTQIADKLGLPPQSVPPPGKGFVVQEIEAAQDTERFVSEIAPAKKGAYEAAGGAKQSLVVDRGPSFSKPSPPKPFP
jgi:hypothetical protein